MNTEQRGIVEEAQYLAFCFMYYASTGFGGSISPSSILDYCNTLRLIGKFCYKMKGNELVGTLSFKDIFTTPIYMAAILKELKSRPTQQRNVLKILNRMASMGSSNLGYMVISSIDTFDVPAPAKAKQHPAIPTMLYINLINGLSADLDKLAPLTSKLEEFITAFADRCYGVDYRTQHKISRNTTVELKPDFSVAVASHNLGSLFTDDYFCDSRQRFTVLLTTIQHLAKYTIHLYTGMRDQEVGRLPYDCIAKEEIEPATFDDYGLLRDPELIINVISTTTKYTGYRQEAAWLATSEVVRAVRIAQAVCRGLAKIHGVPPESLHLFTSSGVIRSLESAPRPAIIEYPSQPAFMKRLTISQADLAELDLSDPSRVFLAQDGFEVGKPWPLSTHQLRRSLALYGSSSGFLSLPSLSKQFKHFTKQLARYYSNNFERIKTIFGSYDPKTGEFILPHTHFLYEFQLAIPMQMAYELIADVLGEMQLYGGGGAQIQAQRERIASNQISVIEFRKDTTKRVQSGELSHRSTFLGSCTKTGDCETYMLGQVSTCLTCDGAAISLDKLGAEIENSERELLIYHPGTGEHQILKEELSKMKIFHTKHKKKENKP
ncbi:integrase [Pseudomonas sp. Fl4BN1]|uniref:integrase n=1 Tax=Pseudomonas sp. Fl4BN1 TaxID=2697651 RepID=UPI001377B26E|nr:integrase [Pseudomonas sp. Fl4BN1]NBF12973.1 integrase [Pseudomonas sp. Fl4BN1]